MGRSLSAPRNPGNSPSQFCSLLHLPPLQLRLSSLSWSVPRTWPLSMGVPSWSNLDPLQSTPPTPVPNHCCRDFIFLLLLFPCSASFPLFPLPLFCPSHHLLKGAWQGTLQGSSSTPLFSPCPDPALLSWWEGSWRPDPGTLVKLPSAGPQKGWHL